MTALLATPDRRLIMVGLLATTVPGRSRAAEPLRIAAAADLQIVLPEILKAFEAATGTGARVTYGASGNLARQIRQGAPFDVFLSADERFVSDLVKAGNVPQAGPVYARGRLAVAARDGEGFYRAVLSADPLAEIAGMMRSGAGFRVAIANPEHAPYGQRAIEVLRARQLHDLFKPRLVFGENVAQATQYIATGAAAVGIVRHSIAQSPIMAPRLVSAALPAALHTPLDQRLAVTAKASPAAAAFEAFIMSTAAQNMFSTHGFDPPRSH